MPKNTHVKAAVVTVALNKEAELECTFASPPYDHKTIQMMQTLIDIPSSQGQLGRGFAKEFKILAWSHFSKNSVGKLVSFAPFQALKISLPAASTICIYSTSVMVISS